MCVYIQVNTEITICRPEQIIQARLGCSGDLGKINKNMDHNVGGGKKKRKRAIRKL